jgi:hypothetical protein
MKRGSAFDRVLEPVIVARVACLVPWVGWVVSVWSSPMRLVALCRQRLAHRRRKLSDAFRLPFHFPSSVDLSTESVPWNRDGAPVAFVTKQPITTIGHGACVLRQPAASGGKKRRIIRTPRGWFIGDEVPSAVVVQDSNCQSRQLAAGFRCLIVGVVFLTLVWPSGAASPSLNKFLHQVVRTQVSQATQTTKQCYDS